MYITYRKNTKEVVMISEGLNQINNSNLETIKINPTKDELDKINQGYILKYDKGLKLEKHWSMELKEKQITLDEVEKATTVKALKDIIIKLIK